MTKFVYADNAATTQVSKIVLNAMIPYMSEKFGNASSLYSLGRESRHAVEKARDSVASAIGAESSEVFFTSGGTESDNWALKGVADALKGKGRHILTTKIEHHAIMHTAEYLKKQGFEITYLDVDEFGMVHPQTLKDAIRPDTILISIMFANNEIGTIEPIKELCAIAKEKGICFHTDAVQAVGHVPINVKELGVDLLSMSAHKFNGPKGIGALYIKKGTKITTFMHGGSQEYGRRASTESVSGIVGLGVAIELATVSMEDNGRKLKKLRDLMTSELLKIPYTRLNGHPTERLDNNTNISFEFVEGESLLLMLDANGICASTGSACTSASLDPSHVLLAIGLKHELAHGSLRITLSTDNTVADVEYIVGCVREAIEKLRAMSPLYEDFLKSNKG